MSLKFLTLLIQYQHLLDIKWPFKLPKQQSFSSVNQLLHEHDIYIQSDIAHCILLMQEPLVWRCSVTNHLTSFIEDLIKLFNPSSMACRKRDCLLILSSTTSIMKQLSKHKHQSWQLRGIPGEHCWLSWIEKLLFVIALSFLNDQITTYVIPISDNPVDSTSFNILSIKRILVELRITNHGFCSNLSQMIESKYHSSQLQYLNMMNYDAFLFRINDEQLPNCGKEPGFDQHKWQHRSLIFYIITLLNCILGAYKIHHYSKLSYLRWLINIYPEPIAALNLDDFSLNAHSSFKSSHNVDINGTDNDSDDDNQENRSYYSKPDPCALEWYVNLCLDYKGLPRIKANELPKLQSIKHHMFQINAFLSGKIASYQNHVLKTCHQQVMQDLRFLPQHTCLETIDLNTTEQTYDVFASKKVQARAIVDQLLYQHDFSTLEELDQLFPIANIIDEKTIRNEIECYWFNSVYAETIRSIIKIIQGKSNDFYKKIGIIKDISNIDNDFTTNTLLIVRKNFLLQIQSYCIQMFFNSPDLKYNSLSILIQCIKSIQFQQCYTNDETIPNDIYVPSLEFYLKSQKVDIQQDKLLPTVNLLMDLFDYVNYDTHVKQLQQLPNVNQQHTLLKYKQSLATITRNAALLYHSKTQIKDQLGEAWATFTQDPSFAEKMNDELIDKKDKQKVFMQHYHDIYSASIDSQKNEDVIINKEQKLAMESVVESCFTFEDLGKKYPVFYLFIMFSHFKPAQYENELKLCERHRSMQSLSRAQIIDKIISCQTFSETEHKERLQREFDYKYYGKWISILCLLNGIQMMQFNDLLEIVTLLSNDVATRNSGFQFKQKNIGTNDLILPVITNPGELIDPIYTSIVVQQYDKEIQRALVGCDGSRYSQDAKSKDPIFHNQSQYKSHASHQRESKRSSSVLSQHDSKITQQSMVDWTKTSRVKINNDPIPEHEIEQHKLIVKQQEISAQQHLRTRLQERELNDQCLANPI